MAVENVDEFLQKAKIMAVGNVDEFLQNAKSRLLWIPVIYPKLEKFHEDNGCDLESWQADLDNFEDSLFADELKDSYKLPDHQRQKIFDGLRIAIGFDKKTKSPLHHLEFQATKSEIASVRKELEPQIPDFKESGQKEEAFWELQTVARKNYIPNLVPMLNDIFQCWRIRQLKRHDKKAGTADSVLNWLTASTYMQKELSQEQRDTLRHALESYNSRVYQGPVLNPMRKVNDSLMDFVKIICNASATIAMIVEQDHALPLQVDVWVIPQNPHKNVVEEKEVIFANADDDDDDDSDDDDEDEDDDDDDEDDEDGEVPLPPIIIPPQLSKLLSSNNIYVSTRRIRMTHLDSNNVTHVRSMYEGLQEVTEKKASIRACLYVDRRTPTGKQEPENDYDLCCYRPPNNFGKVAGGEIAKMHNTKTYMIPAPDAEAKEEALGAPDLQRTKRDFVFSFFIHEKDKIDVYFWFHGGCTRFFRHYFADLLPAYFVEKCSEEDRKRIEEYIEKNFKLKITNDVFESWNREINAL